MFSSSEWRAGTKCARGQVQGTAPTRADAKHTLGRAQDPPLRHEQKETEKSDKWSIIPGLKMINDKKNNRYWVRKRLLLFFSTPNALLIFHTTIPSTSNASASLSRKHEKTSPFSKSHSIAATVPLGGSRSILRMMKLYVSRFQPKPVICATGRL